MRILTQLPSVVLLTSSDVRNYDAVGSSANPGPNAPLGDLCGTSTHPETSAQAGLRQWTAAGFPKDQLMLGLPLYGYVSKSTKTTLKERDTIAKIKKLLLALCILPTLYMVYTSSITQADKSS